MNPTPLRASWVAASLAFVVVLATSWRTLVETAVEDRYGRDLRRTQALHAELDEYVMKCRTGLATSYDPFEQTLTELKRLHRLSEHTPRLLTSEGRAEVSARRAEYGTALADKRRLIDDFKRENSVLRNSLRFFPVAARELADKLAAEPGGSELAGRLHDLLGEVLVYNLLPDKEFRPHVEGAIAAMETAAASPAGQADRDELGILLTHARAIVEHKPRVDDLMEGILHLPVAERAREMDAAYSRRYGAAIDTAATRRLVLSLLAMAILGFGAADIILRLRRTAEALRAATAEAERANTALRLEKDKEKELGEMKSRFVSMTSHEFRTPLTKILQSCELLEAYIERMTPERKAEHFSRIRNHVIEMKQQLEGILVIGRAEAGVLEYDPAPCDVAAFCNDVVETVAQGGGPVRIEPSIQVDWNGARMDKRLLGHILTNLLSNAVKYSPNGGRVEFEARREGDEAIFVVSDEGIGIPADDQPRLFDTFQRASNVGGISGTGLGLAIVKKSVERCHGSLTLDSRPGEGTRFLVRIPC